jgi:hypothetical protein
MRYQLAAMEHFLCQETLAISELHNVEHHYKTKHSRFDDLFPLY